MDERPCQIFFMIETDRRDGEIPELDMQLTSVTFPRGLAHELSVVMEAHFVSQGKRFQFVPPLIQQLHKLEAYKPLIGLVSSEKVGGVVK